MAKQINELLVAQGGVRIPTSAATGKFAVSDSSGNISWHTIGTADLPGSVVNGGSQWVDLCRSPYSASPGTDITSALQAAINASSSSNQDVTIYFSVPGVYLLNGALQSGTANGVAYSGQVLFPARNYSAGPLSIRIMGLTPVANFSFLNGFEPPPAGGVVLQSNATAGWVFDAISADAFGGGSTPSTDIHVTFENIAVRCPVNPQCGGINGNALATLRFAGSCSVDTVMTGNAPGALTGTGIGISFPPYDNMAVSRQDGDLQVLGFPVGIAHSEHFVAENLFVGYCLTAVRPQAAFTGHASTYKRLLVQGCQTAIAPAGSAPVYVSGLVDIGDPAGGFYFLTWVVNDPNNYLYGTLRIAQWWGNTPAGIPVQGAQNLRLEPFASRPSEWPSDTFTRNWGSGHWIGATDATHHVWAPVTSFGSAQNQFTSGAGNVKAINAAVYAAATIKARLGRASRTRTVRTIVALVGTYQLGQLIGFVNSGANATNCLSIWISSGTVAIQKKVPGTTVLATSAAAVVAAGNTYTIDTVVSNPIGGPYTVTVYVNGTQVVTYTLTTTDKNQLTDTDLLSTLDGFHIYQDAGSSVTDFRVMPN